MGDIRVAPVGLSGMDGAFMAFDFDTMLDRVGKNALAVEALGMDGFAPGAPKPGYDAIPMWVADMSFPTAPAVVRAIVERAEHPAFGYYQPPEEYFDAIISWQQDRHGIQGLTRDCIGYQNGVLGGLTSVLAAFTEPGDAVLVHSPTYIGFIHTIEDAGWRLVRSPLVRDADSTWRMDYADMAEKIERNGIKLAVMCSPHNPCGRVWERDELERAAEVFEAHDVTVVADEIWSDIVFEGHEHIPFVEVSPAARERTIMLAAPSKTFSLAGLIGSYDIVFNPELRERLHAASKASGYNSMNVLSMHALLGAYSAEGAAWADELVRVLQQNVATTCDFIDCTLGLEAARPQGTYMVFVDCAEWCEAHGTTLDGLLHALWDVGVAVQDGRPFGGKCHIRMNVALPAHKLAEALARMEGVLGVTG